MKNQLFVICIAALICAFLIALDGNRVERKEPTEEKSNNEVRCCFFSFLRRGL